MDIRSILDSHPEKGEDSSPNYKNSPSSSVIPDLFFDEILIQFKLNRIEILTLMFLYRQVWCRPNLYQKYGISPMLSHEEISIRLGMELDDIYNSLRKLESLGFIETIRSGQYFVRKYFTQKNDTEYGQHYECE